MTVIKAFQWVINESSILPILGDKEEEFDVPNIAWSSSFCCFTSLWFSCSPSSKFRRTAWGTLHPHPFKPEKLVIRKFSFSPWAFASKVPDTFALEKFVAPLSAMSTRVKNHDYEEIMKLYSFISRFLKAKKKLLHLNFYKQHSQKTIEKVKPSVVALFK